MAKVLPRKNKVLKKIIHLPPVKKRRNQPRKEKRKQLRVNNLNR